MSKYVLTVRVYHTLEGRGYKLNCKICSAPFLPLPPNVSETSPKAKVFPYLIESKPSKYRHWECDKCGEKCDEPLSPKVQIPNDKWVYKCSECGGILYHVGRKLYHSRCYEDSHLVCTFMAQELIVSEKV